MCVHKERSGVPNNTAPSPQYLLDCPNTPSLRRRRALTFERQPTFNSCLLIQQSKKNRPLPCPFPPTELRGSTETLSATYAVRMCVHNERSSVPNNLSFPPPQTGASLARARDAHIIGFFHRADRAWKCYRQSQHAAQHPAQHPALFHEHSALFKSRTLCPFPSIS